MVAETTVRRAETGAAVALANIYIYDKPNRINWAVLKLEPLSNASLGLVIQAGKQKRIKQAHKLTSGILSETELFIVEQTLTVKG